MTYPGFSREAVELIHLYESYGWTFRVSSKGHAIGREPDGDATVSVSRLLSRANRAYQNTLAEFRRWERDNTKEQAMRKPRGTISTSLFALMEGFHPSRTVIVVGGIGLGWEAEQIPNGAIRLTRQGAGDVVVRKSDRPLAKREERDLRERLAKGGDPLVRAIFSAGTQEDWHEYLMSVADDAEVRERISVLVPVPTEDEVVPVPSEPEPVDEPSGLGPRDRSLSRAPWIASRGARRGYESKAVVQVSDGDEVVGYECAECGKGFDDPHKTASHFRRAHSFGKGRTPQNPTLDDPVDYHPSSRLIEALAAYLDVHGSEDMGPEEFAVLALTWMRTRPDLPEAQPREPLTDAQIVERIRRLVGAEDQTEEVAVLSHDLVEAEAEVERLTALLAAADARADRLQADLDAWLSLAPKAQS